MFDPIWGYIGPFSTICGTKIEPFWVEPTGAKRVTPAADKAVFLNLFCGALQKRQRLDEGHLFLPLFYLFCASTWAFLQKAKVKASRAMDVSQLHFFLFLASPPVRCWCNYGHLLGRKLSGGPKEVLPRHITPCCLRRSFVPPLSFCLVHFCCFAFVAGFCFFGSNPFFCSEPNGTAPRFCPKDFPCPRGTTRKANITGVVCPSGTCTAQDCCVSIYTCVCLGVCSAHSHKPVHALPFFVGVWNRLSFSFSRARLHPSSWHVSRSSIFYG